MVFVWATSVVSIVLYAFGIVMNLLGITCLHKHKIGNNPQKIVLTNLSVALIFTAITNTCILYQYVTYNGIESPIPVFIMVPVYPLSTILYFIDAALTFKNKDIWMKSPPRTMQMVTLVWIGSAIIYSGYMYKIFNTMLIPTVCFTFFFFICLLAWTIQLTTEEINDAMNLKQAGGNIIPAIIFCITLISLLVPVTLDRVLADGGILNVFAHLNTAICFILHPTIYIFLNEDMYKSIGFDVSKSLTICNNIGSKGIINGDGGMGGITHTPYLIVGVGVVN